MFDNTATCDLDQFRQEQDQLYRSGVWTQRFAVPLKVYLSQEQNILCVPYAFLFLALRDTSGENNRHKVSKLRCALLSLLFLCRHPVTPPDQRARFLKSSQSGVTEPNVQLSADLFLVPWKQVPLTGFVW